MEAEAVIEAFRAPDRIWARAELLARPSPVPATKGLYGWYFDESPDARLGSPGTTSDGWSLLYVGIAPARAGSSSNLRKRIRHHVSGNARGSTLRLTLGSFLAERLGLITVPASGKLHFGSGEAALNAWLDAHARVAWVEHSEPWTVEGEVVRALDLPLNRAHNFAHPAYPIVGAARAALRSRALSISGAEPPMR
jgi:hypothetical protein